MAFGIMDIYTSSGSGAVLVEGFVEVQIEQSSLWKELWVVFYEKRIDFYMNWKKGEMVASISFQQCHAAAATESDEHGVRRFRCFFVGEKDTRKPILMGWRPQSGEERAFDSRRAQWVMHINEKVSTVRLCPSRLLKACSINPANPGKHIPIPYFIFKAFGYIEGLCQEESYQPDENILCICGRYWKTYREDAQEKITKILNAINENIPVDFDDIYQAVGVIQEYLLQLEEPLLMAHNSNSVYKEIKNLLDDPDREGQVAAITDILRRLPIVHYVFLMTLFNELRRAERFSKGKENIDSIFKWVGRVLIWDGERNKGEEIQIGVAKLLFSNYDIIWKDGLLGYCSEVLNEHMILNCEQDTLCHHSLGAPVNSVVEVLARDCYSWTICRNGNNVGLVHVDFLDKVDKVFRSPSHLDEDAHSSQLRTNLLNLARFVSIDGDIAGSNIKVLIEIAANINEQALPEHKTVKTLSLRIKSDVDHLKVKMLSLLGEEITPDMVQAETGKPSGTVHHTRHLQDDTDV